MMIKKLISSIFKILLLASFGVAQANAQTTTAGILPLAKTQFLDENGKPLTSGKVYFYEPSTTTAKTTWQDINKSTPNTNPVTLDAGGRALIWGDGSYRQQVYDRNNNIKWDQVTAISGSSSGGGLGDGLPVGSVLSWAAIVAPINYQFTYGQALARAAYPDLLSALTISESVTCVGGSPIITSISDTANLGVGTVLEASCVTGSPTIISKTASTVTLSGNATVSVTTNGVFYPYGNGDGVTTFNVPDYRGEALVGRCNMGGVNCSVLTATYFDSSGNVNNTPSAINAIGGSQSKTLLAANLPPHTHTSPTLTDPGHTHVYHDILNAATYQGGGSSAIGNNVNNPTASSTTGISLSASTGNNASGISTPISSLAPSKTVNYIIKVRPNSNLSTAAISQLQGGQPNELTGTDANGVFGNVSLPSGLTLSSYSLKFLAQSCAASNWIRSIDISGTFTCSQPAFTDLSGSIAIGQISNNLITNAKLSTAAANTLKGNSTGSSGNVSDIAMPSCSGANQAINWTSGTGPGCITAGGAASVEQMNPGGRLTLASGVPVMTTDQAGAITIYYAPYTGKYVPIYNGSVMQLYAFTASDSDTVGLSIVLGSNWAATTIYDTFIGVNGGNATLCTGPAWSVSTAGSSSRGAGAGTTQLALFKGLQTNAVSITCRYNNTTTFACAANQCLYVGSFITNGSTGTIDFKFGTAASGGGIACLCVYNAYNQVLQTATVQDSVVSYTYTLVAYRQANASTNNQVNFLMGLSGSSISATNGSQVGNSTGGLVLTTGIGIDSVTVNSAKLQFPSQAGAGASSPALSFYDGNPTAGYHYSSRLESSQAAGTTTWFGTAGVTGIQSGMRFQWLN